MSFLHQSFDTYLKSELAENVNRVMSEASLFEVHHHSVDRMSLTDEQYREPMNSRKIIYVVGHLTKPSGASWLQADGNDQDKENWTKWKKTWLLRFTSSWNREGWHSLRQVLYSQPVNTFLYSRCNLAGLLYCILYSPCNRAGLYSWSWRCKWQLALACDCDCDCDSPNHSVVASATAEK